MSSETAAKAMHRQMMASTPREGVQPNESHVLLGRGKSHLNHDGNVWFQKIVEDTVPMYMKEKSIHVKRTITWDIVYRIMKERGGFLRWRTDHWERIPLEDQRQKVAHALQYRIRALNKEEQHRRDQMLSGCTSVVEGTNDCHQQHFENPNSSLSDLSKISYPSLSHPPKQQHHRLQLSPENPARPHNNLKQQHRLQLSPEYPTRPHNNNNNHISSFSIKARHLPQDQIVVQQHPRDNPLLPRQQHAAPSAAQSPRSLKRPPPTTTKGETLLPPPPRKRAYQRPKRVVFYAVSSSHELASQERITRPTAGLLTTSS